MWVKGCNCEGCIDAEARGRIPANAPVRNCAAGATCPCHFCGEAYRGGAELPQARRALTAAPAPAPVAVDPLTVAKIVAGIVLMAVVYAAVMWVMANIEAILTVLAFCGAGAGLGWFLFINPASPLKTWRARRAERAIEERKALAEAARQLPPASQQSLPSASQSSLPPMQVKVHGYTVNKPAPAQERKREERK